MNRVQRVELERVTVEFELAPDGPPALRVVEHVISALLLLAIYAIDTLIRGGVRIEPRLRITRTRE